MLLRRDLLFRSVYIRIQLNRDVWLCSTDLIIFSDELGLNLLQDISAIKSL